MKRLANGLHYYYSKQYDDTTDPYLTLGDNENYTLRDNTPAMSIVGKSMEVDTPAMSIVQSQHKIKRYYFKRVEPAGVRWGKNSIRSKY